MEGWLAELADLGLVEQTPAGWTTRAPARRASDGAPANGGQPASVASTAPGRNPLTIR